MYTNLSSNVLEKAPNLKKITLESVSGALYFFLRKSILLWKYSHHTVFCRWGPVTEIIGNACAGRMVVNWVWTCVSKRSHSRLFCSFTAVAIRLGRFSMCDWRQRKKRSLILLDLLHDLTCRVNTRVSKSSSFVSNTVWLVNIWATMSYADDCN